MIIQIDLASSTPIYEQLIWEIKRSVVKKELQPGVEMPSVRELSSDLGINLHTVNKAYKALEEQGVLLRKRNRFIVNESEAFKKKSDWKAEMDDLLYKIIINEKLLDMEEKEITSMYFDTLKKIFS
ncbi:GntR family transcriptional regulator [Listeria innocua]|uniref:GntR family transcriptional regulator n=1 Tax=Listeria innocua TaxID=1642 RepID=UPI0016272E1E|nr:GntR family transcriptional regulator [Listeria innocua]MBC1910976.1 GntR family transcriptional regulator [Listeria innocua]MBC1926110.1 GntR family transcriptional regulator [Listeria innocua]MBC1929058.1 GntR family transcriptional regulator [Listeria innocua]